MFKIDSHQAFYLDTHMFNKDRPSQIIWVKKKKILKIFNLRFIFENIVLKVKLKTDFVSLEINVFFIEILMRTLRTDQKAGGTQYNEKIIYFDSLSK